MHAPRKTDRARWADRPARTRIFGVLDDAARRELAEGAARRVLGDLLDRATDDLEALRTTELARRVHRCLLRLGKGQREVQLTHQQLADLVGASRANISRLLKRFERAGGLRCHRGRIELLALDRVRL